MQMLDQWDGIKSVLTSHLQSHAKRKVCRGRTSLDWVVGFKVRGAGPGVGSESTPVRLGMPGKPATRALCLKRATMAG